MLGRLPFMFWISPQMSSIDMPSSECRWCALTCINGWSPDGWMTHSTFMVCEGEPQGRKAKCHCGNARDECSCGCAWCFGFRFRTFWTSLWPSGRSKKMETKSAAPKSHRALTFQSKTRQEASGSAKGAAHARPAKKPLENDEERQRTNGIERDRGNHPGAFPVKSARWSWNLSLGIP